MKNTKTFKILAGAIMLGTVFNWSAVSSQAGLLDILRGEKVEPSFQRVAFVGTATVKEVKGLAEHLAGVEHWKPVTAGTVLAPGDMVRTQSGTVLLRMQESGSFIKVTPYTVLRLVEFEEGWDRSVLSGKEEKEGFVVRSCRGTARVLNEAGAWQEIEVNSVIAEGTRIQMGRETVLDLFSNREKRAVRLVGETEAVLNASVFRRAKASGPSLAAVN